MTEDSNTTLSETAERQEAKRLIDSLMDSPETFSQADIYTLLNVDKANPDDPFCGDEPIDTSDLKSLMLRIFDQNENFKFDNAYTGYLGILNNWSQGRRNKRFFKKIRTGVAGKRIVAEGDSWFEHPVVRDVIDWLNELGEKEYSIYSIARGGDFLTNILEEREYITELSLLRPEVFLLSAGGIELVNGRRVALMVEKNSPFVTEKFKQTHPLVRDVLIRDDLDREQKDILIHGLSYLTKEYFVMLSVLELSYKYLIKQLRKKFKDLRIYTHGYDYTVPSFQKGPGVIKYLINLIGGNGHHFKEPMMLREINDPFDQRAISFAMIHLFNEVMINIARDPIFGDKVYHIDCRGYARDNDWHDELHLKPKSIKRVAETYLEAMRSTDADKKVFLVRHIAAQRGEKVSLENTRYSTKAR
uniref:Uncharacterized protein n=1 Tax=Roseihalotalea indica TaxID=2867963 RepID=A0AA49JEJ3_9BACT|nr:hypothetical protein K4G66_01395 [Tunicatimonas sp. TK19036]